MAQNNKIETQNNNASDTAEVLYQKLGTRWYAFSVIDDEVFMGSISQDEINNVESATGGEAPSPKMAINS
jgi:hypothetical protein